MYIWDLVEIIRIAFQDPTALTFHMTPYKHYWRPSEDAEPIRVFGEFYTSDAMLQEHENICNSVRELGCNLETTVAAIMLWSDSTQLASFGRASLWPIYAYIGNQLKYARAKPTTLASHHLAYIPAVRHGCPSFQSTICLPFSIKLPDGFEDYYMKMFGGSPTQTVRTHCKRELMHAIWTLLLTPEFMHAYQHGLIVNCADGVTRQIFPRIFTYSADYPEK